MKHILLFIALFCLATTLKAQQKPPYDRTATNQVMADRGTWSRNFMAPPKGALPVFPSWVPDSVKCGAMYYRTPDTCLYVFNCLANKWDKMAKYTLSNKRIDSLVAVKANLNGGNTYNGPQTVNGSIILPGTDGNSILIFGNGISNPNVGSSIGFGNNLVLGSSYNWLFQGATGNVLSIDQAGKILNETTGKYVLYQGDVYTKPEVEGLATIHVTDKAALQAYSGSATTVIATDSLFGKVINVFNYYPSVTKYDGGVVIQAIGKGGGAWARAFNGNGWLYPEWWGAKPFDPIKQSYLTGTDSRPAVQAAIDYSPHRGSSVLVTTNLLLGDSLELGENTLIEGLNRLIPNQLDSTTHAPIVDTIKYRSQTSLYFANNTNGAVTTLNAVPYRNQGIVLRNIGIFGSGKYNGKTGVLLRLNPNSTAALTKPGLFYMENVSIGDFSTLADGRGVGDSWYVRNSCHFMNARYGLRTGSSNTWVINNDFYNCDIEVESNGRFDDISFNEFEGNKQPGQLGILHNSAQANIHHNSFSNIYYGIKSTSNGTRSTIDHNTMETSSWAYTDSLSISNTFSDNTIFSGLNTIPGQVPLVLRKNNHFVLMNNKFITGSANSTIPAEIDTCNNIIIEGNKFQNYAIPDARAINFVGTTTFARTIDYRNWGNFGVVSFGNIVDGSGNVNISSDDNVAAATLSRTAYGASTARSNRNVYRKSGGTFNSKTALPNTSRFVDDLVSGYNGSAFTTEQSYHYVAARTGWSTTANGLKETWATIPAGGTTMVPMMNLTSRGLKVSYNDTTAATAPLQGQHIGGAGAAPTIAAGAGAGTSPTISISGTDLSGTITLTTGTSPTANTTIATVTFNSVYATAPRVAGNPTAKNTTTATLSATSPPFYTTTTTTLTLIGNSIALAPSTTYVWDYTLTQ